MRHEARRARARFPVFALAVLGAGALGGCGLPDNRYGHHGGYSSYGYSPSYYRHAEHHHRRSSPSRTENWSQQRLKQHWVEQAQKAR